MTGRGGGTRPFPFPPTGPGGRTRETGSMGRGIKLSAVFTDETRHGRSIDSALPVEKSVVTEVRRPRTDPARIHRIRSPGPPAGSRRTDLSPGGSPPEIPGIGPEQGTIRETVQGTHRRGEIFR